MRYLQVFVVIYCLYINDILGETVSAETTFYGARDNCPPGGDIAYPQIHNKAGGNGTYKDPITYAGCREATKPGTIIYVNFLQKYFIMEDDCEECDHDWISRKKWHFDLWMGPDNVTPGDYLVACEDAMTKSSTTVIIDPPNNLAVNMKPLFNGTSLQCWETNPPPCTTNHPNNCGNLCEIPHSGTCQQIANELLLNLTRFEQLNPDLHCRDGSTLIPAGTSVCMGGPCGD
mmetsp:Transcript_105936/g.129227  ORF Transcript_105936/g.129227 Transcript_105936/m.129227 type:complete len:231 (+) Transcript_105936:22-714(+)